MTLQGDLATLELADLVQNLEMHRRSGVLSVETTRGTSGLYFREGAIAMLASERRQPLVEDLVRAGLVPAKRLESARKSKLRGRKSIGELLIKRKDLDAERLQSFAQARLVEDVCDFLSSETGAFDFTAGDVPARVFDPEERRLGLGLPVGPLLFEAARRKDHWPLIKTRVPSDALHYLADGTPVQIEGADPELCEALLEPLDGSRSVREVLRAFPHRRFEACQLLADLVDVGAVRAASPEDLLELARELGEAEPDRAWQVVLDGLDAHPYHPELLREKADLAERRKDHRAAAEALRVIAHIEREADDRQGAIESLQRAVELDPEDVAVQERLLEMAIEDGRAEDALAVGLRLAELYRKPGLHTKACGVFESLLRLQPDSWAVQRELARSQVDSGNPSSAVSGLERYGRKLIARERYQEARAVYEEVKALVPKRKQARRTLEMLDGRVFEDRRRRRRRLLQRGLAVGITLPVSLLVVMETAARLALARAESTISRHELIEQRRYTEAAEVLGDVRASFAWTPTALFDVRRRLRDLERKQTTGR